MISLAPINEIKTHPAIENIVKYGVEWIDDDTVKLIYKDGRHNGKYYEEFEIDL